MPANEQTWRDSKLLHVVFGISSIVMLDYDDLDDGRRPQSSVERRTSGTFAISTCKRPVGGPTNRNRRNIKTRSANSNANLEAAQEAFTIADRKRVDALFENFKKGEEDVRQAGQ